MLDCNREVKLLKLKANYNEPPRGRGDKVDCNCEINLLKLKANYNIKECYVVLNGKSVLITNHDRNYIRKVLARLKE